MTDPDMGLADPDCGDVLPWDRAVQKETMESIFEGKDAEQLRGKDLKEAQRVLSSLTGVSIQFIQATSVVYTRQQWGRRDQGSKLGRRRRTSSQDARFQVEESWCCLDCGPKPLGQPGAEGCFQGVEASERARAAQSCQGQSRQDERRGCWRQTWVISHWCLPAATQLLQLYTSCAHTAVFSESCVTPQVM